MPDCCLGRLDRIIGIRGLAATLAALAILTLALPAGAATCETEIPAAQSFLDKLRPGPNTAAAQRHLDAAKRAPSADVCAAELRQVDKYARRSQAADQRAAAPGGAGEGNRPSAARVQCADFFHQARPGGSDYHGPPVPGCPAR
jgi:hypothetical protein